MVTGQPASLARSAVVYLERQPEGTTPPAQTVTVDNRQMNFIPYVAIAPVGARVAFHDSDPFPHNVFSPDGEKFNLGNIPQGTARVRTFERPGAYTLLCNLHPGMIGYLLVTPSSFYARVDAKGAFTLKGVPAGTYDVSAWAPRLKPVTQSVTVPEGDVTVNFELHR
jgi:plastocyanin